MKAVLQFFKRHFSFKKMLDERLESPSLDNIERNENQIIMGVMLIMCIVAILSTVILDVFVMRASFGRFIEDGGIFIVVGIFALIMADRELTPRQGTVVNMILLLVPYVYVTALIPRLTDYEVWMYTAMVTLIGLFRIDVFFMQGTLLVILGTLSYRYIVTDSGGLLALSPGMLYTRIALFVILSNVALIYARYNRRRTLLSIQAIHTISHQNDEITAFNEELQYSNEELMDQNEHIYRLYEELASSEEQLSHRTSLLREKEKQVSFLSDYDILTELPNRRTLMRHIEEAILNRSGTEGGSALSPHKALFVVVMDLDGFKHINDTMGHKVGDGVLQIIAGRLKKSLDAGEFLGRLSADEFVLVIEGHYGQEEIVQRINVLHNSVQVPIQLGQTSMALSASFGVAQYPKDGETSIDLLKCSDAAMHQVKENGKNAIAFFIKDQHYSFMRKMELANLLSMALERNEFFLNYQPMMDMKSGRTLGFEVLLRWQNGVHGLIGPDIFIPIAEENRLIRKIGQWVLERALRDVQSLNDRHKKAYTLSVNISPIQLESDSFIVMVENALKATHFPPEQLILEVTESVLLNIDSFVIQRIEKLRAMGVLISLDDFGTGYSSLKYLKSLPVDIVKIDRSFVTDVDKNQEDAKIVRGIISIMKGLGKKLVAEGIETAPQLTFLKSLDCDIAQGYYLSKPLSFKGLQEFLESRVRRSYENGDAVD